MGPATKDRKSKGGSRCRRIGIGIVLCGLATALVAGCTRRFHDVTADDVEWSCSEQTCNVSFAVENLRDHRVTATLWIRGYASRRTRWLGGLVSSVSGAHSYTVTLGPGEQRTVAVAIPQLVGSNKIEVSPEAHVSIPRPAYSP